MRFTWTDDQIALRDTLLKFVAQRFPFEHRKRRIEGGFDPAAWAELADLGALGMPFDEACGGSGGSALDTLIIMEAFGRSLVVEPFMSCIILAGSVIRHGALPEQQRRLIPSIAAGEARYACAFAEEQSRYNLANVTTRAVQHGDHFRLNGKKAVVYGAPDSHTLIVAARTAGESTAAEGISLFLVPTESAGLSLRSYTCIDGMAAADVSLVDVQVGQDGVLGELHQALPALERAIDDATTAICGEAVGIMGALIERCIEHAKSRQAFGKPLAQFQVIGHRIVDLQVSYEVAAASALKAAAAQDLSPADRRRAVSAAKVQVAREAAFVGKSAVQLHGAMGTTDELDIGHYFKRLMTIQTLFGGADFHLRRYIQAGETQMKVGNGY